MDRIWAPWRMEYVEHVDEDREGCFLCAAGCSDDDLESLVLWRGARAFVILNKYPYTGGHLMVAPFAHGGEIKRLDGETLVEMMRMAQAAAEILEKEMKVDGLNIGLNLGRSAGAGLIDHLHLHVVPRWQGDTNFMPVLGGVRVIPEAMDATWRRLRPCFEALAAGGAADGGA